MYTEKVSIGQLRESLKYRSREAMNSNWSTIFNGEVLPDDHIFIDIAQAKSFVEKIAIPQRGRPGTITGAAQQLLKVLNPTQEPEKVEGFNTPGNEVLERYLNGVNLGKEEFGNEQKIDQVVDQVVEQSIEEPGKDREGKKDVFDRIADLSGLDWVYLVTVGIADYGLVILLKEMGLAAGIVYTLISFHALAMAKNRKAQVTANRGITAVWILEILAFFVHLTLFNRRLWGSIEELPFTVSSIDDEYRPFLIAVILASLFSAAGIYAVSTTLALLKEGIEAEEYETNYGKTY